uniref:Uncharacterized protein n=1 Tax=Panthera leo TaxID=9689 RepID=A0A8C8X3K1_PANLE
FYPAAVAALRQSVSFLFDFCCLAVVTWWPRLIAQLSRGTRDISPRTPLPGHGVCLAEVTELWLSVGSLAKESGGLGRLEASPGEEVSGGPEEPVEVGAGRRPAPAEGRVRAAERAVLGSNRTLGGSGRTPVFMPLGGGGGWKPAQAAQVVVEGNPSSGFGALAPAASCPGFAGVGFDKVLQGSGPSLRVRNMHASPLGVVATSVDVCLSDGAEIRGEGLLRGGTGFSSPSQGLEPLGFCAVRPTDGAGKGSPAAAAGVPSPVASVTPFGPQGTAAFAPGAVLGCARVSLSLITRTRRYCRETFALRVPPSFTVSGLTCRSLIRLE